jgi:PAS domain S-box-containing protein
LSIKRSDPPAGERHARSPPAKDVTRRWGRRARLNEASFFAGFGLAVAVFLTTGTFSYRTLTDSTRSAEAVEASHAVIADLDALLTAVTDLEARQRAYLLSEEPTFLLRYSDRMAAVDELLRSLEARASANPAQREPLKRLRERIVAKESSLLTMALERQVGPETLRVSSAAMDEIRAAAAEVRAGAEMLLARRLADAERVALRSRVITVCGSAVGVALLLVAGWMFLRNVAARRRLESERERFFTLSLDLLCIAGTDGYFKRLNPAFTEALGWTSEEMLARPYIDFVHPDDRAGTQAQTEKIAAGDRVIEFENRYRCKDGSFRWLRWKARPFPEEGLVYAIARDVTSEKKHATELVEAGASAEAANRAKSTFLATMSHEIRTPLIGVLGMLEVVLRSEMSEEQRSQLNIVHHSAQALLGIIGDILDFSKIEAGKIQLEPVSVPLREVLSRCISNFSATARAKGLALAMDYDAGVAPAHIVDPTRLSQIVANWVSNALKFTEHGGVTVRLRLEASDAGFETLTISVADTGMGIPPEHLQRLFQPFVQADVSTTRRFGGTGLGLAITRRLAELLGGTVAIDSAVGRGTTISLRLTLPTAEAPEVRKDELPASTPLQPRPLPTFEQARSDGTLVLLAEDHPVNRKVLTLQLNMAGFQVDCAEDGLRALEKFKANRYCLVLTDLHMPGLDGYQLTSAIRVHERAAQIPRTPVIALTANVRSGEIERCLAADMDDYLSKPVTIGQLTLKIERWLYRVGRAETSP